MTLYVNERQISEGGRDWGSEFTEASLRDKLTDRGWGECPDQECVNGQLVTVIDGNDIDHTEPHADCVEGLVPPEGMVETAAKALYEVTCDEDDSWEDEQEYGYPSETRAQARAALIAAARWEREQ